MRKISAAVIMLFILLSGRSYGQNIYTSVKGTVEPLRLAIAYQKTTNLIFPYAIKAVDRGSRDVLVQKAEGVENILQVKAANHHFPQTNLTVVTAEGALYSFLLDYAPEPSTTNLKISDMKLPFEPVAIFSENSDYEAAIQEKAQRIAVRKSILRGIKDKGSEMELRLSGVYIAGDVIYYQISLENNSNINYDIDQFRLYIQDKKKARRTATQEIEQRPLFIYGNNKVIPARSKQVLVVALRKFTIPDKKRLVMEMMEQHGGRHLKITIGNKTIVKAALVP